MKWKKGYFAVAIFRNGFIRLTILYFLFPTVASWHFFRRVDHLNETNLVVVTTLYFAVLARRHQTYRNKLGVFNGFTDLLGRKKTPTLCYGVLGTRVMQIKILGCCVGKFWITLENKLREKSSSSKFLSSSMMNQCSKDLQNQRWSLDAWLILTKNSIVYNLISTLCDVSKKFLLHPQADNNQAEPVGCISHQWL
jgi:hypothetical protein